MSQQNGNYGGYGMRQAPMTRSNGYAASTPSRQVQQEMQYRQEKHQLEMEALKLDILTKQRKLRGEEFPEQFRAGVIKYTDRFPFPMLYRQEALDNNGNFYASSLNEFRATFNVDVEEPTYLWGIDFALKFTAGNAGGTLNNCYLPLNASKGDQVFVQANSIYPGLDFDFEVETSADDQMWQHGLRPSSICKSDYGYRLPIEYELNKNEVVTVKVTPLREIAQGEVARLYVILHCYKMKKRVV